MFSLFRLRSFSWLSSNGSKSDQEKAAGGLDVHQAVLEADRLAQPGELTFEENTAGGMQRHLGLFSTTFLIIGRMIGTGIFSAPSSITAGVGSVGAALLLWVLGLALSFAGVFVWLEFGCMFPRSGGEKVYLEAVYRRPKRLATVVFAMQAVFLQFSAAPCIVFAKNLLLAVNVDATEMEQRLLALSVIVFTTSVHTFLPNWGVRIQNALASIKVVFLCFIVVTGWVVLSGRVKRVEDPTASFRNAFAGSATSSNAYATALFKVLNSYSGYTTAAYVLNEVKRPVRTLKIAGPLSLAICGTLYIFANIAYFSAATPTQVGSSGVTVAAYFVSTVFGDTAKRVLSVFVALSALGNTMTATFAQSRVNQELAKEGIFPYSRFWASSWPCKAPSGGLLLHLLPSILIMTIPFGAAYAFLLDVEGYPTSILHLLVVLGLFWMRYHAPGIPRPFRVWLPIAGFYAMGQGFLIVAPFLRPDDGKGDTELVYWLYAVVGMGVLLSGVVYWAVWRKLVPLMGRFRWVERKGTLKDGTVVTLYGRERRTKVKDETQASRSSSVLKISPKTLFAGPFAGQTI
ncbi:MAG: hypothetical protein M1812_001612 [Candelaria pacifica]|nr:MAG: hypothetical protein M1812_001612 [Candelaria pacifica]